MSNYIKQLKEKDDRNKRIVALRLRGGHTFELIAAMHDISRQRVMAICKKYMQADCRIT